MPITSSSGVISNFAGTEIDAQPIGMILYRINIMTVSNQPRVWPTVPDRNYKTKRSMGTGCDRIISYGYYCDHYNTHNYSASHAERFSREPLKPVVTIGKLLSFTAYYIIMYIIHIPRRIHKICTRHAYTTALQLIRTFVKAICQQ